MNAMDTNSKDTPTRVLIWQYIAIGLLVILLALSLAWGFAQNNATKNSDRISTGSKSVVEHDTEAALEEHGIEPLTTAQASNNQTTAEQLTYLLEEEKLAHDVYLAMSDVWGARIFNNIKNSESMHQNMVLAVMQSRNLPDPRSGELGVFTNPELQKLYDELIVQGNQSRTEAFKVDVLIEETDIADLKKALASLDPKDTDIKDVLENLLHGSENHLRAFNRQV